MNTRALKTVALTGITLMLALNAATGYGDVSLSGGDYSSASACVRLGMTCSTSKTKPFHAATGYGYGATVSMSMTGTAGVTSLRAVMNVDGNVFPDSVGPDSIDPTASGGSLNRVVGDGGGQRR